MMTDDVRVPNNLSEDGMSNYPTDISSCERLEVELKYMHDENDRIKIEKEEENKDLRSTLAAMKEEYTLNLEHMNTKLNDAHRLIAKKDAQIKEKDVEIVRLNDGSDEKVIQINEQLESEEGKNAILSQKLSDAVLLNQRTMLAFDSQKELVDAKNEIIENLKKEISNIKHASSYSQPLLDKRVTNLTSNSSNHNIELVKDATIAKSANEKIHELSHHYEEKIKLLDDNCASLKLQLDNSNCELGEKTAELIELREKYNMVYLEAAEYKTRLDCIEEKTTGVRKIISESGTPVYNHVLVWLSNQIDMNPENSIYEKCSTHFLPEEIDEAKSALFDACGGENSIIGKKETRKGGAKESKIMKDSKDLIEAMKKIKTADETEILFITSADGVMKCPENTPISCAARDELVLGKINNIEKTLSDFFVEQKKQHDRLNGRLESALKENSTKNKTIEHRINDFNLCLNGLSSEFQLLKHENQNITRANQPAKSINIPSNSKSVTFQDGNNT